MSPSARVSIHFDNSPFTWHNINVAHPPVNKQVVIHSANPKYALTRLYTDNLQLINTNWPLVEKLLLHAMMVEPGGILAVARILLEQKTLDRSIDNDLIGKTLAVLISKHSVKENTSEVAWALWTALAMNIKLANSIASVLGSIDDSVVSILSLDAMHRGCLEYAESDLKLWEQYKSVDELYGSQWLLSYEGQTRDWFECATDFDKDAAFSYLREKGVSFYEPVGANALENLTEKLTTVSPFDYGIGENNDEEF